MDGQSLRQTWAWTTGSDNFSHSGEHRFPPKSTLAEMNLADFYEFDDKSHVDAGFTKVSYIDDSGVPRTDTFPDIDTFDATHVFGRNQMTSAFWEMRVSNVGAAVTFNYCFWGRIS
ncbi:hypothetical protein ACFWF7_28760 [Nocardia sp. NPDC060256]|uniref:hypothetical protein n=1 Tax=unclassified Nocardia TaxID=2637762 RepID=UPI0036494CB9